MRGNIVVKQKSTPTWLVEIRTYWTSVQKQVRTAEDAGAPQVSLDTEELPVLGCSGETGPDTEEEGPRQARAS
jgi:hypothetical protein